MDLSVLSLLIITGASPDFFNQLLKLIFESIYLSNCFLDRNDSSFSLFLGRLSILAFTMESMFGRAKL